MGEVGEGSGGGGDHVPEAVERRAVRVRVFILAGGVWLWEDGFGLGSLMGDG